ncbi:MAG: JAB domain-containing protein [Candidatus Moranbacteria bacterium]|nr:JAB domain-containing protein [Candidatus Moranbacteria bacterium]
MLDNHREHFIGLYLNTHLKVIKVELISLGTINTCIVHPREVFRPAIVGRSAGLIVLHNHPSNDIEPSEDDMKVTRRLKEVGEIMQMPLYDHIIFSGDKFVSMKERGGVF